ELSMKIRTIFTRSTAALALAFTGSACAQQQKPTPVAPVQVAAAEAEMDGPALWKVADEDTTIYLFGTVHLLPNDIEWKTDTIRTALSSSDTLVTEIDMTEEALAAMGPLVQSKAMLSEGQTLRSLLSAEQRTSFEGALAKLGMPANALDPVEPWFAALTLANVAYAKNGMNPELGVETVLESAVSPDTKRDALETVEFQFAIFDELPMDQQIKYLMETAEQLDDLGPTLDKMIAEWAAGNPDGLGDLMNEALEGDPALADKLLYARNANWAIWIDDRMDMPGTLFMAVGAGHLAGEKSVQDYLVGRGFTVTRVQ
ncbi:MAG: TraB/GumN family protein, partial [Pontixanthobacter sp.]